MNYTLLVHSEKWKLEEGVKKPLKSRFYVAIISSYFESRKKSISYFFRGNRFPWCWFFIFHFI